MSGGLPQFESQVRADSFSVQKPQVQSSEAESLFRTAAVAGDIARQMGARYEQEAAAQAAEAGAATMIYEQQPDGTQRLRPIEGLMAPSFGAGNRAYNEALLRNYGRAVETDARQTFGRMQTQFQNDPGGFAAAAQGYIQETTGTMPRAARAVINTQLQTLATGFSGQIAERQSAAAREQIFATDSLSTQNLARDLDALSRSSVDQSDPRIGQSRERLRLALEDLKRTHPERVNDLTIDTVMRATDRTLEGNRLSNETLQVYRQGGITAAMRHVTEYANRPDNRFTTEERDQIVQRGIHAAQDLDNQAQLGRARGLQARADAERNAQDQYNTRNRVNNPGDNPDAAVTIGRDIASRQPTQALQDIIGNLLVRPDQIRAARADERRAVVDARIAQDALPADDYTGREAAAARARNRIADPDRANEAYQQLNAPVAAARGAAEQRDIAASEQYTLTYMSERNQEARTAGQPEPFSRQTMQETLPVHMWPAAEQAIARLEEQTRTALATRNTHAAEVNRATLTTANPPASQAAVDSVVANLHTPPGSTQERVADLTNDEDRRQVYSLANRARVIPTALNDRIAAGLSTSGTLSMAQRAQDDMAGLMANQETRQQMETLLGARADQFRQNGSEIQDILTSPQYQTNGVYDPNKGEARWRAVQMQREAASRLGAEEIDRRVRNVTGNENVPQAMNAELRTALNQRERYEEDPLRAAVAAISPIQGLFFDTRRPVSESGTGVPNYFASWVAGNLTVPVATGDSDIPVQLQTDFNNAYRQQVALGGNNPEALRESARRTVLRDWQTTYLGSEYTDRAIYDRHSIEAYGRSIGLNNEQLVGQLVGAVGATQAAATAAGATIPMRTPSPLAAVANGDLRVQTQYGTDGNPHWVVMYRPPDVNGVVQPMQPMNRPVPTMEVPGVTWNVRASAVFQPRPDPASQAMLADRARVQALAVESVNRLTPDLPTPIRNLAISLHRLRIRAGLPEDVNTDPRGGY